MKSEHNQIFSALNQRHSRKKQVWEFDDEFMEEEEEEQKEEEEEEEEEEEQDVSQQCLQTQKKKLFLQDHLER